MPVEPGQTAWSRILLYAEPRHCAAHKLTRLTQPRRSKHEQDRLYHNRRADHADTAFLLPVTPPYLGCRIGLPTHSSMTFRVLSRTSRTPATFSGIPSASSNLKSTRSAS